MGLLWSTPNSLLYCDNNKVNNSIIMARVLFALLTIQADGLIDSISRQNVSTTIW